MTDLKQLGCASLMEATTTLGWRVANKVDDLVVELERLADEENARRRPCAVGFVAPATTDGAPQRARELLAILCEIDHVVRKVVGGSEARESLGPRP